MNRQIAINSKDYWVKIIGMLQQNWALIDTDDGETFVYFISDTGGVFDRLTFPACDIAEAALTRNGFERLDTSPDLGLFLHPPARPFHEGSHPNGPIYSSGRFWV